MKFANFKRKVADNEIPPEKILKRYRWEFPNEKVHEEDLEWRHAQGLHTLYDKHAKRPRFIVSDKTRPLLICGKTVKSYNYKLEEWTPDTLPKLCTGSLLSIFKHLQGWDLLSCRLVSREWNRICTKQMSLWELPNLPSIADSLWPNYSPFRAYVQHMFLNASDATIIDFFFKHPELFSYICTLFQGPLLKYYAGQNYIIAGRYTIRKGTKHLICDNRQKVSIQVFLDAYRQFILIKI